MPHRHGGLGRGRRTPRRRSRRRTSSAGQIPPHTLRLSSLAFGPDGRTLATSSSDGGVELWDTATGRSRRTHLGYHGAVFSPAFSPDGRTLAIAGEDHTVRLGGRSHRRPPGHASWAHRQTPHATCPNRIPQSAAQRAPGTSGGGRPGGTHRVQRRPAPAGTCCRAGHRLPGAAGPRDRHGTDLAHPSTSTGLGTLNPVVTSTHTPGSPTRHPSDAQKLHGHVRPVWRRGHERWPTDWHRAQRLACRWHGSRQKRLRAR
ncbi:WD40 repeat domain-containing protein [Streptomyces mirabilis]|uniref:WD40 repeat domain-containing protein n=1 Tax=Streptomyces mirabilis TaxID=68239 RepID=UPI0036B467D6